MAKVALINLTERIVPRRPSQLAMKLSARPSWGGRRDGAGRKPGDRPAVRHLSRTYFRRPLPAHVTLRLLPDLISLRDVRLVRELERSFAVGCERPGFRLVHYSLQGNHAHLIIEAQDRATLGRGMMSIASRLARAVNRIGSRSGEVLADRYHVRMLATPREVHRALRYVLLNAKKHSKDRAKARPLVDPASSARWFEGWKRGAVLVSDDDETGTKGPPVARARTWLLTIGWRRHGLIDPSDVPG